LIELLPKLNRVTLKNTLSRFVNLASSGHKTVS
jgi:hypothetical protein